MAHELSVQDRLRARDAEGDFVAAVVVEELTFDDGVKTLLHFGNPYLERPTIVTLPSPLSKAEAEEIVRSIIPFPEACDVLSFIAENYSMRLPILIEGPTALGKTFLINKFVQLMYGKQAQPVDFYCQGQTDVSELMAKWVPRTESAEDEVRWELYAESPEGVACLEKLSAAISALSSEEGAKKGQSRKLIDESLRGLTKAAGLSGRTEWQLQYGAVPKAMLGEISSQGVFKVREPSEIQLWEDGGRRIKAGPDFWYAMSTNPPEEYDAREPVDQALARGVVFKRLPELSDKAYEFMARRILGYKIGNIPPTRPLNCVLELHQHPAVCKEIADIVAHFHKQCVDAFRTGESSRQQRIPVTFDDMARVGKYLACFQVRSSETGLLDLTETLRRACERMYLSRLLPPSKEETSADSPDADVTGQSAQAISVQTQLRAALEQLLTGEIGMVRRDGKLVTRKQILDGLVTTASADALAAVSQAALPPEEKAAMVKDQVRNDAQDTLERVRGMMARRGIRPSAPPP
jgi:MoxR-like ATPase